MKCPRHGAELVVEHHKGIEIDRCPECSGRWLDHHELDILEDKAYDDERPKGTRVYGRRSSELRCPRCGELMQAFNYRARNLEIDYCAQEHGFWLDAGEEKQVGDLMEQRIRDLDRASSAEDAWGHFLAGLGKPSFLNRIFGRRR